MPRAKTSLKFFKEDGSQYELFQGHLYTHKGAIFKNLIADILTKMNRKLCYYHKDS